MNFAKHAACHADGVTHFLTYADNNAVGYFAKQGFTKEITMDRSLWHGYIKDYDGGTLMECVIDPRLPHTELAPALAVQRACLDDAVRAQSNSHVVYPGLAAFAPGAPRTTVRPADVPGVAAAGWPAQAAAAPAPAQLLGREWVAATPDNLAAFMRAALNELSSSDDAWPFLEPVDARDVPDYHQIIKDPVDIRTLGSRLQSGDYYATLDMFAADVRRMFSNARIYNAADTVYAKLASKLEAAFDAALGAKVRFGPPAGG